jgi:hypothetical protein
MSKPRLRVVVNGQDDITRKIARDSEAGQKRRRHPTINMLRFRNDLLHGLKTCLPKVPHDQRFDCDDFAELEALLLILETFGDDFIATHFVRRKPRVGWPVMAKLIGRMTLLTLQNADRLAGHRPRRGYGRAGGPLVAFIFDRLARIVGDAMPSHEALLRRLERDHEALLRRLERAQPKAPPRRRKRRRKPRQSR